VSGAARITAAPVTARVDTATTAHVATALRGLFPDVNPRDYRCCCDSCGEPWEACIGMACATCPVLCAACAPADGWVPCASCGEDIRSDDGERRGTCDVCHAQALSEANDERQYREDR